MKVLEKKNSCPGQVRTIDNISCTTTPTPSPYWTSFLVALLHYNILNSPREAVIKFFLSSFIYILSSAKVKCDKKPICFDGFPKYLPPNTKTSNIHKQCIFRRKFLNKFKKYIWQTEMVMYPKPKPFHSIQDTFSPAPWDVWLGILETSDYNSEAIS